MAYATTTFKIIKTYFLLFSLAVFTYSCIKKGEPPEVIVPSMSFNVNGTVKTIEGSEHVFASKADGGETIVITAKLNSSHETVVLTLHGFKGKGDYPVAISSGAVYTNGSNSSSNLYTATTGLVTVITYQSNGLKGSFNFKSFNSEGFHKTLTDGSFEALLTN